MYWPCKKYNPCSVNLHSSVYVLRKDSRHLNWYATCDTATCEMVVMQALRISIEMFCNNPRSDVQGKCCYANINNNMTRKLYRLPQIIFSKRCSLFIQLSLSAQWQLLGFEIAPWNSASSHGVVYRFLTPTGRYICIGDRLFTLDLCNCSPPFSDES